MAYSTLINSNDLHANLDNPNFILLDCRYDLNNQTWGYHDFCDHHIKGSIFVDLNNDLSSPRLPGSGRHPLPIPEVFVEKLGQWGVAPQKQVVAIATSNGTFAARIWWLLQAVGHQSVAVLDGGLEKWIIENKPLDHQSGSVHPTDFRYFPSFKPQMMRSSQEVLAILANPSYLLLDSRSPERFRGEEELIDPIAGRIPGAANRWTNLNLQSDGSFKPANELRKELASVLHNIQPGHVISYCGSGVTACLNLLALEVAGFHGALLYPGSWSEWIQDTTRPIERG